MKRLFAIVLLLVFALVGCGSDTAVTSEPEVEVVENVSAEIAAEYDGESRYLIVLELKQSHFTLDISEHIKDSMNKVTIPIFVDEEFYNAYEVGDALDDSFRWGSFWMSGSFGNWKVTVSEKQFVEYE